MLGRQRKEASLVTVSDLTASAVTCLICVCQTDPGQFGQSRNDLANFGNDFAILLGWPRAV